MLADPVHLQETSQPSKQVKKCIQSETAKYVLNLFMEQINSFTEVSQIQVGQPASFNQLLISFSMHEISQLSFTFSKSKIETLGRYKICSKLTIKTPE